MKYKVEARLESNKGKTISQLAKEIPLKWNFHYIMQDYLDMFEELQEAELKNADLENEVKHLKEKLKLYEGDDIVATIVWSTKDFESAFERYGVPINDENIEALKNSRAGRTLSEVTVEQSWDIIYEIVSNLKSDGILSSGYTKTELYDVMLQVAEELQVENLLEVYQGTDESHPELIITVDDIYDLEVVEKRVLNELRESGITEEEVEIEAQYHGSDCKYMHFLLGSSEIADYDRAKFIMATVCHITNKFVKQ